jgi:DNA processing protein
MKICSIVRYFEISEKIIINIISFSRSKIQKNANFLHLKSSDFEVINFDDKSTNEARLEMERTFKLGGKFIPFFCDEYPANLKEINNPPPLLICLGNPDILNNKSIAIVGSRNASYNGLNLAENFAKDLFNAGITVVSGLARGVDAKAHIGSIKSTIAVIGSGIDSVYPFENKQIYTDIVKNNSAIITEFAFGIKPMPANFPQRNRIIAGISLGTLIVEAGMKSGSLSTARLAFEAGREVFAIPGFALDPSYKGNNYLIKKNIAKLVEEYTEIIEEFDGVDFTEKARINIPKNTITKDQNLFDSESPQGKKNNEKIPTKIEQNLTEKEPQNDSEIVLKNLTNQYVEINEICARCSMSAEKIATILMQLELEGKIQSNGVGYCRIF